ncbi:MULTISPECIES: amidase [Marivita]|uniref:Amidase n=1 Tax=Marivita cryptomonadis TaxID=505252 RepID=A0A9Q2NVK3_9RHOB|nr:MULTISPECIES: amidase [Marivita]MCR9168343.1 amidase [Paracoccaceae bacterium]MBM2323678.1 amidase [Marivita cryptomonadis]MBM2333266.1 amidase [Marivita cryptomonadis]MBM2342844.1 amidase [Marivita cryptomonadis]MBM2347514.1 amidase [Marivita cryptomonadis]
MTDPHQLSLHALSGLIGSRQISALELTDALIERCNAMASTSAMITPTFEIARDAARLRDAELAQGISRGPMHGIPLGLKDAFAVQGVPTKLCGRTIPDTSADVWHALDAAGMALLGKLHCAEFCLGAPGAQDMMPFARNPFDPARSPGASSSGSAVALATGMVPAALGTDTGGSIRIPAAFCGVVGLKPTGGLLSAKGIFPLAPALDQAGPMARDSRDCAMLMDALLSGSSPSESFADALTERLDGVRIGYVAEFGADAGASPEQRTAVAQALNVLTDLGATVEEVALPPLQVFTDCFLPLMLSEAYALHAHAVIYDVDMSANTRVRLQGGAQIDADSVKRAKTQRAHLEQMVTPIWTRIDALVFEVVPGDPPLIETIHTLDYLKAPMLAVPANLLNTPSLAVRCGTSQAGLPIGLQILGPRYEDRTVLRIGHAYEQASGHTGKPVEPVQ